MTRTDIAPGPRTSSDGPTGALPRIAGWCYDHRRRVLILWIVALVAASALAGAVGSDYQDKFDGGNAESQRAQDLLEDRFPARAGDTMDVVFQTATPVTAPENQSRITALAQQLQGLPHVAGVRSPFDQGGESQIAASGDIAYVQVQFDQRTEDLEKKDVEPAIDAAEAVRASGFDVELGGGPVYLVHAPSLGHGELIGVGAAIIILLIAFGSVVAMGLPILTALVGIGIGFAFVAVLSQGIVVPTFGPQLAAMIGIGVGIDYALFIVTRFREVLARGVEPRLAAVLAIDTSGRAVLFAGCTVVISLLGMLLMGVSFIYGLAFGAIGAVLLVMAASMTLLPAMLGFAGRKIDRWRVPGLRPATTPGPHSLWYRWSRFIQRRPLSTGTIALVALVVLAIPVLSLRMLFTDAGNDPESLTTRHAYDLLSEGFGPGSNGPLWIVVDMSRGGTQADPQQIADAVAADPDVVGVSPPQVNPAGDTAVIVATPRSSPQAEATKDLVERLRHDVLPPVVDGGSTRALVGGLTAGGIDAAHQFSSRLIYVIGGVVILSFLLLMMVFRSIAVPVKAAIMNLLSIGAAYGVIVAVFQWGWAASIFGVDQKGPIDPWIPLMLFTILFGLSMDYEVFLLSRIREQWLHTGENATAVADGLALTARVITAAAAIMFCVFGSFVISDLRVLKVFGMGLAVAVLVDATIVRMVLVPATMELLGRANWWMPKWLDRLLPRVDVEGHDQAVTGLVAAGNGGAAWGDGDGRDGGGDDGGRGNGHRRGDPVSSSRDR
jgi:RND superfamily putative drug exporter